MQALVRKAGLLDDEYGLHMIPLSVLLIKTFGPEVLTWDLTALRQELTRRWGDPGIVTWERVQAMILLHSHNIFWEEWEIFEKITAATSGEIPIFQYVQPPEAEEMAIVIEVAKLVDSHAYSHEVKQYIVASCLYDGLWYLDGTPMEIAQEALTEYDLTQGIDRDVGNVASALARKDGFYDDPQGFAEVQANKVREVQLVVKRYTTAVERQLREL